VVGGPDFDGIIAWLLEIAEKREWTAYERKWAEAQKDSSKQKSGHPAALWQAEAEEELLEMFAAHAVPHSHLAFNPLLGTGGNAGRRDFAKGWKEAVDSLQKPPKGVNKQGQLRAWLLGNPVSWLLAGLGAGSWFSSANKLYNSGQQPYREEPLSPWAMAIACEGLPFFAGAPSRRLGARARAQGAFPFICQPAAPTAPGEAGRDRGEVWAPLWDRPMTLPEVRALFQRGRAEVRGRGANTPAAFAAAIVRRGVDAGISSFLRFSLGRTTSENTFEPRFEGSIPVRGGNSQEVIFRAQSDAVERILALVEKLPADRKQGSRWRFVGLRGPVEAALIRLAQTPDEPEAVRALLDATASALDKVDRNRSFREKGISWQPLPLDYLPALFGDEEPALEARLALALVSSFPRSCPFTLYRFGVEWQHNRFRHPTPPPPRWVWGPGELSRNLVRVLSRRTLDWEEDGKKMATTTEEPVRDLFPTSCWDVSQWLHGNVDEYQVERWLWRLALFDWRTVSRDLREKLRAGGQAANRLLADGPLCLFGLLQPLFDHRPLRLAGRDDDLLDPETGARTPAVARRLIALIQAGQLDAAVDLAASRYAMARTPLAKFDVTWFVRDPHSLLASLLFTVFGQERAALVQRWLRPQRKKGEVTYV
jgi:CRISPR-associated protein Csx17